jgi:ferrous iron transport protein A
MDQMKLQPNKNSEYKTLAEVRIDQRARVVKLLVEGQTRRRLLDLGLLPGTEVRAVMKSPLGDPTAYEIRGSVLALRSEDASKIVVKALSAR